MKVYEAMTTDRPSERSPVPRDQHAHPDQDVAEAVVTMARYRVRAIPVSDSDQVVGAISMRDVTRAIARADVALVSTGLDSIAVELIHGTPDDEQAGRHVEPISAAARPPGADQTELPDPRHRGSTISHSDSHDS